MWTYLGILFMIKIERTPEIEDCWFTKSLFCTPWYGQKCFFAFFKRIFEFTHFVDKEVRPADCECRLHKVRPFLNSLSSKLHHIYVPEKEMSIDEGVTAWKDWFIFKVYMCATPRRYGIKDYLICKSQSGYICNMEVYIGM
jgi:hypothetical protein